MTSNSPPVDLTADARRITEAVQDTAAFLSAGVTVARDPGAAQVGQWVGTEVSTRPFPMDVRTDAATAVGRALLRLGISIDTDQARRIAAVAQAALARPQAPPGPRRRRRLPPPCADTLF